MNNAFNISKILGTRAPDMGIDWEFQPSLQHRVVRTESDAPGWAETMPAEFGLLDEPVKFRETLEGLAARHRRARDLPRLLRPARGHAGPRLRTYVNRGSSTSRNASPIALSE